MSAVTLLIYLYLSFGSELRIDKPSHWTLLKKTVPSVDAQYSSRHGYSEVKINYTQYGVPTIRSLKEFEKFVLSQYPQQSNQYPAIKKKSFELCGQTQKSCYVSFLEIKNLSSSQYIILKYFRQDTKNYLAMSNVPVGKDTNILAQKIKKEILNAKPK